MSGVHQTDSDSNSVPVIGLMPLSNCSQVYNLATTLHVPADFLAGAGSQGVVKVRPAESGLNNQDLAL